MTRYTRGASFKGKDQRTVEEATPWNKLKNKGIKESQNDSGKSDGNKNINKFKNHKNVKWKHKMKEEFEVPNTDQPQDESNNFNINDNCAVSNNVKIKFKRQKRKKEFNSGRKNIKERNNHSDSSDKLVDLETDASNLCQSNYKRRKPIVDIPSIYVDGKETNIARFEGFPVRRIDAERLKELKRKLIAMKVPRNELISTLKLERRRAEKALARERKKVCFQCKHSGHVLSACPQLTSINESVNIVSGICFKCGSTEHQHNECRVVRNDNYNFATCFICKEEGHISKQCPDNPRGLYPYGGACKMCGDVTHLKKDCPQAIKKKKEDFIITAKIINNEAPDALDDDISENIIERPMKKCKIIKMNK